MVSFPVSVSPSIYSRLIEFFHKYKSYVLFFFTSNILKNKGEARGPTVLISPLTGHENAQPIYVNIKYYYFFYSFLLHNVPYIIVTLLDDFNTFNIIHKKHYCSVKTRRFINFMTLLNKLQISIKYNYITMIKYSPHRIIKHIIINYTN